jgi:hypothetical protein
MSQGRIYGELSPRESIPGIDKAKRNARGMVEYSARIVLIAPEVPSRGNGTLLVDIPNRGNAYAQALYNSPRDEPFQSGTFEQGTGFLQDHGFSVAEVYWELGKGADLPSFADADGRTRYVEGVGFAIVRDAADFLAHARRLALAPGDLLAIRSAGAYAMAMSSNYNTRPRACEVLVDGADAVQVRTRERVEDLFAQETMLPK